MTRLLFVCLGNICRSPTAEAVSRSLMPDFKIDSAGTASWHEGKPPYAPMQEAARRRGYNLSSLRARQFKPNDFEEFDLILAMDAQNLSDIEALRPTNSKTRVKLLTDFAPEAGLDYVPDPYYTRNFDETLDLIEMAVKALYISVSRIP